MPETISVITETIPEVGSISMSELTSTVTGMMGNFSVTNLAILLAAGVGIAGGLVLLWFGFNYIKRKLMGALKGGKL